MATIGKIARRTFLFGSAAIVGGVAFGIWQVKKTPPNPLSDPAGGAALNAFVMIDGDGVTLIAPRAEMGQGTRTTWAALLAEEMDLDWRDIRVIHGPPAKAYYNSALLQEAVPGKGYDQSDFMHWLGTQIGDAGKLLNMQVTGGSSAMKDGYERMRVAGAAAREMLKGAAAKRLGIGAGQLRTQSGQVIAPDGTAIPYTDLAVEAAGIKPTSVALRPREAWKLLGTSLPRVDMVEKTTGTAQYAIDVRLPGLKFATVRMSPRRAGMVSYDASAAEAMPGVERIVDLGDGVAVIASNTWLAIQAANAITIDWAPAPYPPETDGIFTTIEAGFDLTPDSTMRDDGNVDAPVTGGTTLEATYKMPFLAHATMEPMSALAWITPDGLEVWTGGQAPTFVRAHCADEAGLSEDRVTVHTTYLGGGFGRRGEVDFAILATRVAKALPGTPVLTTWSREEDMTHDFYRPGALARMRGAVKDGTAVMLDAQVSSPAISPQAMNRWLGFAPSGPDKSIVDGMFNQPYAIPNYRVRGYAPDPAVPIGFWRSVGASINGFFHESFVDELAIAAGSDPLAFRLDMAEQTWEPAATVLRAVRDMSGWSGQTPDGVGRGVAMVYSFGTPVAMVIELRDEDGSIRMTDAWIACDMGVALDPSIVRAQMSGGMVYGLSAAIGGEITFADGMVEQQNFPDYDGLRISAMPRVTVNVLEVQDHLTGAGEPGTPPAAPALANALYDLTGKRARHLPLSKTFDFVT